MNNLVEIFYKRFFGPSVFTIQNSSIFSENIESERKMLRDKYIKWINRRFLYHRLSLVTETRKSYKPSDKDVTDWIHFLFDQGFTNEYEQLRNTWSSTDKSMNINILSLNPFRFHRNPVANSSDSIRGKIGYSTGIHIWKIHWPQSMRGTHAVIGVATDKSRLHHDRYVSLVGYDKESWGWDIVSRLRVHDKESGNPINSQKYPDNSKSRIRFHLEKHNKIPETIFVILDMFQGTLSFMTSNVYLGVAHTGLKGKVLYPTVSAVWGHCEVALNYFNFLDSPPSLKSLSLHEFKRLVKFHCRYNETSGKQYKNHVLTDINPGINYDDVISNLNIPQVLKNLLLKQNLLVLKF